MPTRINMKHPFQHVGTSQAARLVKALSTGHFRLDERSMQDLISAAHAYARMLRYHDSHVVTDPQQALNDNWTGFWEVENLTYMAVLAAMDTDQIRRDYESIDAAFGEALDAASGKKSKKNTGFEGQYFRQLLVFTQKTALKIEQHYLTLRDDIALKSELLRLIRRDNAFEYDPDDVEGAMHQLVGWHKAWDDELGATLYQPFRLTDGRWGIRNLDEYHCILPDSTLLDRDQIRGLFLRFFNILVVIKARAQQLFDAEMARLEKPEDEDPRPLAPHIALFITFLNLFRHAQDSLNDIPQRHLDFYYDQVLGLERRPASPDHAYLIFTLAKEFNQELIEKGTPLLAGKDDNGQPIIFKTLEQWKVTKAEVAAVKALNHQKSEGKLLVIPTKDEILNNGEVNFRPFADEYMSEAGNVGFAVASPQLILREGLRRIQLNFSTVTAPVEEFIQNGVVGISLSTADGWAEVSKGASGTDTRFDVSEVESTGFSVNIILSQDFPSVVQLTEVDKATGFGPSRWPMIHLKISSRWINVITITDLEIKVDVSNVKEHLIIQTDQGLFNGLETVFPFGPVPKKGHRFYLGSTEIFQKSLESLQVHFDWIQPSGTSNIFDYYTGYEGFKSKLYPSLNIDFIDRAIERSSNFFEKVKRSGVLTSGNSSINLRTNASDIGDINVRELITNTLQTLSFDEDSDSYAYVLPSGITPSNALLYIEDPDSAYYPIYFYLYKDGVVNDSFELLFEPKRFALTAWTNKKLVFNLFNEFEAGNELQVSLDGGLLQTCSRIGTSNSFKLILSGGIPANITAIYKGVSIPILTNGYTEFDLFFTDSSLSLPPASQADIESSNALQIKLKYFDNSDISQEKIEVFVNGVRYFTNEAGEVTIQNAPESWTIAPVVHPLLQSNGNISGNGPKNVEIYFWPVNASYITRVNLQDNSAQDLDFNGTEIRVIKNGTYYVFNNMETPIEGKQISRISLPLDFNYFEVRNNNFDTSYFSLREDTFNTYFPDTNHNFSSLIVRLFPNDTPYPFVNSADLLQQDFDIKISSLNLKRDERTQHFEKYTPTLKRGFIRMTLAGNDFLHHEYPKLLADTTKAPNINAPYTPSVNGVSVNYVSRQSVIKENNGIDDLYHTLPFGGFQLIKIVADQHLPLLPSLHEVEATSGKSLGNLYIGLENLIAGDNLSLYIQLEEGSEKNFELLPPQPLWYYLSDNVWKAIDAEKVLRDTTNGLTRSGLVQLAIPNDATDGNTVLPADFHWLAVKVIEGDNDAIGAFPSIKSIRAQAIEAIFAPADKNDLARLNTPLPAQTISKLAQSRSAVKKVEQPYDSFGGLRPESDATEFYRRVSERLRHRDRAVTVWDYEHLLLEKYRSVAIAKCITHTRYEATHLYPNASEIAPGFVTMSVIPDLTRHPNMVREEPRFSRGDLTEMRDHLLPKTNLFLQPVEQDDVVPPLRTDYLQVVNPQYEPVHVLLTVWFKRGADVNLAKYQINEALRRLFAPWLYEVNNGPVFGRAIRRSELVQLIESMDAVDVIETLEIFHLLEKSGATLPPAGSQPAWDSTAKNWGAWEPFRVIGTHIRPDNARSILTTVAKHTIVQGSTTESVGTPPVVKVITVAPRMAIAPPPEDEGEIPEKSVENPKKATAKLAAKTPKAPAKKRK